MPAPLLVLFGSSTSPFVRKVRVALLEKGIPHRFELASAWAPDSRIGTLNPLHKVPVLRWPDGQVLSDSRVIVQALELRHPLPALLPLDGETRLQALQLEALADGVCDAAALFTQEGWRQPAARSAFWCQRQRNKVEAGLQALDDAIAPWLPDAAADAAPLGLVPIAVGSALGFVSFWMRDLDWAAGAPRLADLAQRLDGRPAWVATAPHLPEGASFPQL